MKTLSIKQPWAQIIAIGLKDIENRSWPTKYRGKILIHASLKPIDGFKNLFESELLTRDQYESFITDDSGLGRDNLINSFLQKGAIIGTVEIIDCVQNSSSIWAEEGQYHWVLKNSILFEKPILNVKVSLSLWNYNIPEIYICDSHNEVIECPSCMKQQQATVNHTTPFYYYVHECEKCQYIIMESDWNKIEKPEGEKSH